jgi:hypothetical protein
LKNSTAPVLCKIRAVTATNIFYIYNGEYLSDYMSNVKYCSKPSPQASAQNTTTQTNPTPTYTKHDLFNPTGYIALSIGGGFPLGKYRDSGFANTGINLSLSAARPFNGSKLGIAVKVDYGNNSVNQTELNSYFQSNLQNTNLSGNVTSKGNWSYINAAAGLCAIFPGENISFELRGLVGLMFANSTGVNANVFENNTFVGTVSQPAASATSVCLNLGAGLRYRITPEISLLAYFDFEYSNPQFSVTATAVALTPSGNQVVPSSGNVSQVYELGNLTVGIAWTPIKTPAK